MLTTVGPRRGEISLRLWKTCMLDLERNAQPIVGELHVWGQFAVGVRVMHIVGHMGEVSASSLHLVHKSDGLLQAGMTRVRRLAQRIDNNDIEILEQR